MEDQNKGRLTIQAILKDATDRIQAIQEEIDNIETPTRHNLELRPPGYSGNRYSIHLEERKAKLRNEIENTKSEVRATISSLIEDNTRAQSFKQVDLTNTEKLRPVNFDKEQRELKDSQECIEQKMLESKMRANVDRNDQVSKEDNTFFNRFGKYLENKSEITKHKDSIEPDKD